MAKHYLLFYAWETTQRGDLVLGDALGNPPEGAVLFFRGDSPEVAERFAKSDPYVIAGEQS